jgi:hypothetical protein
MSTAISDALTHLITNWRSTVNGFLTISLVTSVALLGYPPVMQHPKWVAVLGGVQVLAKAYMAVITVDAK